MADKILKYSLNIPKRHASAPVRASTLIEAGDACSRDSSGRARPLTVADANFAGFAQARVDNSSGAAGAEDVRLWQVLELEVPVTGVVDEGDVDSTVYMTDEETFTLSSTGGVQVGKITEHKSGTTCKVLCEAGPARSL